MLSKIRCTLINPPQRKMDALVEMFQVTIIHFLEWVTVNRLARKSLKIMQT